MPLWLWSYESYDLYFYVLADFDVHDRAEKCEGDSTAPVEGAVCENVELQIVLFGAVFQARHVTICISTSLPTLDSTYGREQAQLQIVTRRRAAQRLCCVTRRRRLPDL